MVVTFKYADKHLKCQGIENYELSAIMRVVLGVSIT